jgi:hypothetical protein
MFWKPAPFPFSSRESPNLVKPLCQAMLSDWYHTNSNLLKCAPQIFSEHNYRKMATEELQISYKYKAIPLWALTGPEGSRRLWLSQLQEHSATKRIMSIETSNDTIRNRSCDLLVCSAVLQPTAPL